MARLSFRCDDEMVERVDRARRSMMGSVPREAWLRDAVELALRQSEQAEALARGTTPDTRAMKALQEPDPPVSPEQIQDRIMEAAMIRPAPRRHSPTCKCSVCS